MIRLLSLVVLSVLTMFAVGCQSGGSSFNPIGSAADGISNGWSSLTASPDEKLTRAADRVRLNPTAENISAWERAYDAAVVDRIKGIDRTLASNQQQLDKYNEAARLNPDRASDIGAAAIRHQQVIDELTPQREFYAGLSARNARTGALIPEYQSHHSVTAGK